jgi:hypothetical protein
MWLMFVTWGSILFAFFSYCQKYLVVLSPGNFRLPNANE